MALFLSAYQVVLDSSMSAPPLKVTVSRWLLWPTPSQLPSV